MNSTALPQTIVHLQPPPQYDPPFQRTQQSRSVVIDTTVLEPRSEQYPSPLQHRPSSPASHIAEQPTLGLNVTPDHNTNGPRKGFDSEQFRDSHSTDSSLNYTLFHNVSTPSIFSFITQLTSKENVYNLTESAPVTIFLLLLMLLDFICFAFFFYCLLLTYHSHPFSIVYSVVDWITAIAFLVEVHLRLYGYGIIFYFHSMLRSAEYITSVCNTVAVVAYYALNLRSLLLFRYIRIFRTIASLVRWRERLVKTRTRKELVQVARLLEQEQSVQSKLINWRIDSAAIVMGKRAGEGGFGTVFSGLFRGTLVAVKQISCPEGLQASDRIEEEAVTLVNLRHPNVILFMGFVHEPSRLWIVTEYCSRGSMRDILDRNDNTLTQGRLLKLALGAARGLAYLHGQQPPVLHLDLKTSNILISSGWEAKLGDFGLSKNVDNIQNDSFSGTMQYSAPEILMANQFSTAADVYSFGICLWEMAARSIPFQGLSPTSVLWGVVKESLRPPVGVLKVGSIESKPKGHDTRMHISIMIEPTLKHLEEDRRAAAVAARELNGQFGGERPIPCVTTSASLDVLNGSVHRSNEIISQALPIILADVQRTSTESVSSKPEGLEQPSDIAVMPTGFEKQLPPPTIQLEDLDPVESSTSQRQMPEDSVKIGTSLHQSNRRSLPAGLSLSTQPSSTESIFKLRSALGEEAYVQWTEKLMQQYDNPRPSGLMVNPKQPSLNLRLNFPIKPESTLDGCVGGAGAGNLFMSDGSGATGVGRSVGVNGSAVGVSDIQSSTRSRFSGLSRRVTHAIAQLDDRPPAVRRRGGADSYPLETGDMEEGRAGRGLFPFGLRSSSSPRKLQTRVEFEVEEDRAEDEDENVANDETPFERRMRSFSNSSEMGLSQFCDVGPREGMPRRGRRVSSDMDDGSRIQDRVGVPIEYIKLMKHCWAQDPLERPTAGEIVWRLVVLINEGRGGEMNLPADSDDL